jgi:acyl-CoA hydrolase
MKPQTFTTVRLVKSEDLNHHKTLFAGRCAEWFVEAGFIAVASVLPAEHIVCLKLHGLEFTHPLFAGDIACFESKIITTGCTSLKVYVSLNKQNNVEKIMNGFITFVYVDQEGKSQPHGLSLELTEDEDIKLNILAKSIE